MAISWIDISADAKRKNIYHFYFKHAVLDALFDATDTEKDAVYTVALSKERKGWYWGVFHPIFNWRISPDPNPYETREAAESDAEKWLRANYPEVLNG